MKMKKVLLLMCQHMLMVVTLLSFSMGMASCGDDDEEEGVGGGGKYNGAISGVAQKGQFLRGSSVTIYALDENLDATGLSYPTQTSDDMGSFTVNNVDADFIDIKANGYYYNENRGETSNSTINLQAVAATGSNVNVNLLTTLAYNRIRFLVKSGLSFADAQNRAQIEVLTALGLGNSTTTNFTDMNIAGSGDANGLLLAASLLIQQDRSVGDVSKLISDIAADMEDDGILSSDLDKEIHRYEHHIYVGDVIRGLISFYEKNKVENFSIPTFYKFLDTDRDGKPDGQADYIFMDISYDELSAYNPMDMNRGYDANGFTRTVNILSTIPFNVESDAEWLAIEKKTIAENIYAINLVAQANTGKNRTTHVLFSDNSGKELANYTYQQKCPENLVPQRLIFYYSYSQNGEVVHLMPDVVGVNGKTYSAVKEYGQHYHGLGDYWYVDVPYSDKKDQYQLYFPISMVSMPDGYGTFRVSIPESISSDEFPFVAQYNPYYSAYYYPQNPADVRLLPACASIWVNDISTTDHVILSADRPIWGSADYRISDGRVAIDDPQINEQTLRADDDGKYRMTVQVKPHDGFYEYLVPVLQSGVLVHVECYDSANNLFSQYDAYSGYYNYNSNITR